MQAKIIMALGLAIIIMVFPCVSLAQASPSSSELDEDIDQWMNSELARIEYQNAFDRPLSVSCGGVKGMYKVSSVHSNYHEDRSWSWECRDVVSRGHATGCSQTSYVNDFDSPMNFMCPANKYIAGVESYHDNKREDRRWKFTCCAIQHHVTASCRQTGFVNGWDEPMNFQAGYGEVITGVYSYHNNWREDRRFGFTLCKIQ